MFHFIMRSRSEWAYSLAETREFRAEEVSVGARKTLECSSPARVRVSIEFGLHKNDSLLVLVDATRIILRPRTAMKEA